MSRTAPRTTVRITELGPDDTRIDWVQPDGSIEFTFNVSDLHPSLTRAVLVYGLKQVIADGGAVGRDVPEAERLCKMEKRARALRDGTWSFRDGHAPAAATPDWQIAFDALVDVGALPPVDSVREAFRATKPAERMAMLRTHPDALRTYNERKAPTSINGADLLARLTARA